MPASKEPWLCTGRELANPAPVRWDCHQVWTRMGGTGEEVSDKEGPGCAGRPLGWALRHTSQIEIGAEDKKLT